MGRFSRLEPDQTVEGLVVQQMKLTFRTFSTNTEKFLFNNK